MTGMNITDRYAGWWNGGQEYYKGAAKQSVPADNRTTEKETDTQKEAASGNGADKTCREQILEKMEEMAQKVKDGTVEPTFQIGAMTYTIKEWKKMLEKFDAAQEALQEEVKKQAAEVEKQAVREALRRAAEGNREAKTAVVVTEWIETGHSTGAAGVTSVVEQAAAAAGGTGAGQGASSAAEGTGAGQGASSAAEGANAGQSASSAAEGADAAQRTAGNTAQRNTGKNAAGASEGTKASQAAAVVTEETIVGPTAQAKKETEKIEEEQAALLTEEVTKCSYDDPKNKHWFITAYTQDGVICKEAYFDGARWVNRECFNLAFTEEGQYEKVLAFVKRFPSDANLRFAANEDFWRDFLAGKIDEDDFAAFFETTRDGVPDYTYTEGDSTYIDREKAKYARYMNRPGSGEMMSAEQMMARQDAMLAANKKKLAGR